MASELPPPTADNGYLVEHARLLLRSYETLIGHPLMNDGGGDGRKLYEAPFFVASHTADEDPILTYGNHRAQRLFEREWDEFIGTPSRFTAEAPQRAERARLLSAVGHQGFIENYSGIRVSKIGRRFQIENATVWNLLDADTGAKVGQAATFASWTYL